MSQVTKLHKTINTYVQNKAAGESTELVSRERCIMSVADGLARVVLSLELWIERAQDPVERRTVERLKERATDLMAQVHNYTRTL